MDVPAECASAFTAMEQQELDGLRAVRWRAADKPGERLACQARVLGDATVTKKYVREAGPDDALPLAEATAR
jgi:hypothetical protein